MGHDVKRPKTGKAKGRDPKKERESKYPQYGDLFPRTALEAVSQLWCKDAHASKEMDATLALDMAKLLEEERQRTLDWVGTATMHSINAAFYRDICQRVGKLVGPEVYKLEVTESPRRKPRIPSWIKKSRPAARKKENKGSPGHVIRRMYDQWAWTNGMEVIGVYPTREEARTARRNWVYKNNLKTPGEQ